MYIQTNLKRCKFNSQTFYRVFLFFSVTVLLFYFCSHSRSNWIRLKLWILSNLFASLFIISIFIYCFIYIRVCLRLFFNLQLCKLTSSAKPMLKAQLNRARSPSFGCCQKYICILYWYYIYTFIEYFSFQFDHPYLTIHANADDDDDYAILNRTKRIIITMSDDEQTTKKKEKQAKNHKIYSTEIT